MRKSKFKFLFLFVLVLIAQFSFSQNIDSVKLLLKSSYEDTLKLNRLAWLSENITDDAEWPKYNDMVYKLAGNLEKSNNEDIKQCAKRNLGNAINNLGYIENNKGNYDKALEYYEKSLKIRKEIND